MSFPFLALLEKLIRQENLTSEEIKDAMHAILSGEVHDIHISAFLCLLRAKKETKEEIVGIVHCMLESAQLVTIPKTTVDIVGTGGDGANTVNISTAAAIVAASCGALVTKHGNRSVSSKSGSADVIQALGVSLLPAEHIAECTLNAGISFLYAPYFHPTMQKVASLRKTLKLRTVFNVLGPLLNPVQCQRLVIGVYDADLCPIFGDVLLQMGTERALIVHCNGLDELNTTGIAQITEICQGKGIKEGETMQSTTRSYTFDPTTLGLPISQVEDLRGGSAEENAHRLHEIFKGNETNTPLAQTIALNAGAALYVYGDVRSIGEGYEKAIGVMKTGKAMETLQKWIQVSNDLVA